MKMTPIYKNKLLTLPAEAISQKLSTATKDELKVLLAVYTEPEFDPAELAARLEMTENVFLRALETWRTADVMQLDTPIAVSATKPATRPKTDKPRAKPQETRVARYTATELAQTVEKRHGCMDLLDSCQQILGKMFNASETSAIVGLLEQLSLSEEFILRLCTHAAEVNKNSVRYVEKLAIGLYDQDITTYADLENELDRKRDAAQFEAFIRSLFGIGKRTLIKKEKDFLAAWSEKYHFPRELIEKAYEITVAKTGEANLNYANGILENWYAAGYKSVADVEAAENERAGKAATNPASSSFVTNEFFEAALMRSYSQEPNAGTGGSDEPK